MKKKYDYRKLFKFLFFVFALVGLVFFAVQSLGHLGEKWVGVESGYVSISSNHRGLIITNEIVYRTLNSGHLENAEKEGERIKKSQVIGTFVASGKEAVQNVADEKSLDENEIKITDQGGEAVSIDKNQVKLDAEKLYKDLKQKLKSGVHAGIKDTKRDLIYTLEHLNKIDKKTYTVNTNINENEKYIGSKDISSEQRYNIVSSESGIVSYYLDDLAGKLKYEDRYLLNYEKLFNEDHPFINNMNQKVYQNDRLLKIIYKQKWHLLCESSLEDLDAYKIDDRLQIKYNGETFDATIVDKFKSKNMGILCLEISQVSSIINNSRLINVTIESSEVSGIQIPPAAIVSENYIKGVYVKGLEGEKIFRPVQVLGYQDNMAIVSEGSYTYKDKDGSFKTVDTVNRNDKILIKSE